MVIICIFSFVFYYKISSFAISLRIIKILSELFHFKICVLVHCKLWDTNLSKSLQQSRMVRKKHIQLCGLGHLCRMLKLMDPLHGQLLANPCKSLPTFRWLCDWLKYPKQELKVVRVEGPLLTLCKQIITEVRTRYFITALQMITSVCIIVQNITFKTHFCKQRF